MRKRSFDTRPLVPQDVYTRWAKDHNIDTSIYSWEMSVYNPHTYRQNKVRCCGMGQTYLRGMKVNAVCISFRNYDGSYSVSYDVNTFLPISRPPYPTVKGSIGWDEQAE